MEECVEELVKECHFWRQQLLALNYRNWNLEFEKKSLRDKYEGLLEKTKHDTNILLKLKDSQKKLTKKTKEYFKTDRELSKIHFVNTDQTSNRRLREMEWRNLANHLKKNTSIMAKINKFHNRIQSRIEEEKKRGEGNLEKCEKKMKVLRETLESNHAVYEDFQKILADREVPVDDLKALVTDGLKIYLGLEKKEEEEEEEEIESIDEEPEKELETGTPTELSEVGENKSETKVVEKEKSETTVVEKEKSVTKVVKKKESQLMNPAQRNIFEEWQSTRTLFLISKQMNSHLLKYYEFISSRMKELTGRFMEVNREYNLKDSELQELQKKASDFRDTVRQKRRNCPIPPRDPRVELKLRCFTRSLCFEREFDASCTEYFLCSQIQD
ncbi:uncharacterized protein CDAR_605981 [Caerostris darwini]|uniref:Uncharacterized protein n=1 Tax=Caerostris darwini TaxID=1538125 RepID=A0AAV4U5L4_9ARAC|nr:uncharacterized protein CDAR_605981 [Caerostris darwini]